MKLGGCSASPSGLPRLVQLPYPARRPVAKLPPFCNSHNEARESLSMGNVYIEPRPKGRHGEPRNQETM